jgi:hypothetical protein
MTFSLAWFSHSRHAFMYILSTTFSFCAWLSRYKHALTFMTLILSMTLTVRLPLWFGIQVVVSTVCSRACAASPWLCGYWRCHHSWPWPPCPNRWTGPHRTPASTTAPRIVRHFSVFSSTAKPSGTPYNISIIHVVGGWKVAQYWMFARRVLTYSYCTYFATCTYTTFHI